MERIMAKENDLMQHENLSDMVKSGATEETITFHEENLDMPVNETPAVQPQTEPEIQKIQVTSLNDWIDANVDNFPNIKKPKVAVDKVDMNEQLLLTVFVSIEDGNEKRKLALYDDSHLQPVLDLPAVDMQIYNNGFRIIYDYGNGVFIKTYGVRTGLIAVFCNDIDDRLIPYSVVRIKKRDRELELVTQDPSVIRQKLTQRMDFEALQLRYKQSSKTEGFTTNQEGIDWLLERQGSIGDIHHHLQIDTVIIDTLE